MKKTHTKPNTIWKNLKHETRGLELLEDLRNELRVIHPPTLTAWCYVLSQAIENEYKEHAQAIINELIDKLNEMKLKLGEKEMKRDYEKFANEIDESMEKFKKEMKRSYQEFEKKAANPCEVWSNLQTLLLYGDAGQYGLIQLLGELGCEIHEKGKHDVEARLEMIREQIEEMQQEIKKLEE